jgi:hypothetical protein
MRSSQTEVVSPAKNQAWSSSIRAGVPQTVLDLPDFGGERLPHFPGLSFEGDGALEAER